MDFASTVAFRRGRGDERDFEGFFEQSVGVVAEYGYARRNDQVIGVKGGRRPPIRVVVLHVPVQTQRECAGAREAFLLRLRTTEEASSGVFR